MSNDNRRGIFNDAPNFGNQTYNEAPQQRRAPDFRASFANNPLANGATVQVRVYGMEHEPRAFGEALVQALAAAGLSTMSFGHDGGTRSISGVIVESAPNQRSRELGAQIVSILRTNNVSAEVALLPPELDKEFFVRIAVGADA